jgi:Homeodomain-like domain
VTYDRPDQLGGRRRPCRYAPDLRARAWPLVSAVSPWLLRSVTSPSTPAQRLAALLAHVREGWPLVRACRVLGVSYDTVWRWRRTKPEFAAALHEAEQIGADVRGGWREDDLREQYSAHVLEQAERYHREDAPGRKSDTRKQRRLLAKLHGVNTSLFPGCSPSDKAESGDPIQRMSQRQIRACMSDAFAERRRQKRAGLAPSTSPKDSSMAPAWQLRFLKLVSAGASAQAAAKKLGIEEADIHAHRKADAEFATALGEALGAGAEVRGNRGKANAAGTTEKPKRTGVGRVLW